MLKKIITLFIVFVVCAQCCFAQQSIGTYTVKKGETLTAIASKHHCTLSELMRLNALNTKSKIQPGQKIKVPVKIVKQQVAVSAPATQAVTSSEVHVVGKKETLFSISNKYGITVDELKQWNHLSGNGISMGQKLIIKKSETALTDVENIANTPAEKQAEESNFSSILETVSPEKKAETIPVQEVKQETKMAEEIKAPVKKANSSVSKNPVQNIEDKDVYRQKKYVVTPQVQYAGNETVTGNNVRSFFAAEFEKSPRIKAAVTLTGISGTFKTAAGWTDYKYYMMSASLAKNTLVKVKSSNGNVIYAKVISNLEDMKANKDQSFRISEAAAAVLQAGTAPFQLTVQYIPQ